MRYRDIISELSHPLRFYAFWAINAPLESRELRRQIEQFRDAGLDGVVWHPRFYPNHPPYLSESYFAQVSGAVMHAKSLGMDFWIYDENGWPSGTVSGELLKKHPDDRQQWAELVKEEPNDCLASFEHGGGRWFVARRFGPGVDYLNPELVRHFIAMTHERYSAGLSAE